MCVCVCVVELHTGTVTTCSTTQVGISSVPVEGSMELR